MKDILLVLVFWSSIQCPRALQIINDGFQCVTDYWFTITCSLNIHKAPSAIANMYHWLEFKSCEQSKETVLTCPITKLDANYVCTLIAKNYSDSEQSQDSFSSMDCFSIDLCNANSCYQISAVFVPCQNIQPAPPIGIAIQRTPGGYFFSWRSGYENHRYLRDFLYQLSLQKLHSDEKCFGDIHNNYIEIDTSHFDPLTDYNLQVRSQSVIYAGQWSKWSAFVVWRTDPEGQPNIFFTLIKFVVPFCIAAGVLLFLFFNRAIKMRVQRLFRVPSPAPFFEPLFTEYKGNLKDWLAQRHSKLTAYKTDEPLATDVLIIVSAKTITEEQEPPTTAYTAVGGQPPYVVSPVVGWMSIETHSNCQKDSSYTQLPCASFNVGLTEVALEKHITTASGDVTS